MAALIRIDAVWLATEPIDMRAGTHREGVRLQPLVDALKQAILAHGVLHADETPVAMLKPGTGKTHRAYLWAYTPGAFEDMKAVVYDFADNRAGQCAQDFLGEWRGALV